MTVKTIWQVLFICMGLQLAGDVMSDPCYMPVFYEKMFQQTALESETGDTAILVAETDPLTATGKGDCEQGCTNDINNGRFDLLLRNAAAQGPDQVPLSVRIQKIRIGFEDPDGRISSQWVLIENQQIAARFGTPVVLKTGRPFDSPEGYSDSPDFLEPGEGIIGCISLSQKDRHKTGRALIEVSSQPAVWMLDLSKNGRVEQFENTIRWRAQYNIRDLARDRIRLFQFTVPNDDPVLSDIQIFLDNAHGLDLFYRRADLGWSRNIDGWQPGAPALSGENAGKTFFFGVRSNQSSATGTLTVEYMTNQDTARAAGSVIKETDVDPFVPTLVGLPSTRMFKAYALGMGSGHEGHGHE